MGRRGKFALTILLHVLDVLRSSRLLLALTIDNRLTILSNDCYARVSIGSKFPDADILSKLRVSDIAECEEACTKEGNACRAFAFGVSAKGDGSCALGMRIPTIKDLDSHPDYDVYVKEPSLPRCESNRLYEKFPLLRIGKKDQKNATAEPVLTNFGNKRFESVTTTLLHPLPYSRFNDEGAAKGNSTAAHRIGVDRQHVIADIVENRNRQRQTGVTISFIDEPRYSSARFVGLGDTTILPTTTTSFANFLANSKPVTKESVFGARYKPGKSTQGLGFSSAELSATPAYYERPKLNDFASINRDPMHDRLPQNVGKLLSYRVENYESEDKFRNAKTFGERLKNDGSPDLVDAEEILGRPKLCYRKLQPGKKTIETHIGRIVKCKNVQECRRACDYEKEFPCEGFNYRRTGQGVEARCELTSTPYLLMDIRKDFRTESRCDYYGRNRDCRPVGYSPETGAHGWNCQTAYYLPPPSAPPRNHPLSHNDRGAYGFDRRTYDKTIDLHRPIIDQDASYYREAQFQQDPRFKFLGFSNDDLGRRYVPKFFEDRNIVYGRYYPDARDLYKVSNRNPSLYGRVDGASFDHHRFPNAGRTRTDDGSGHEFFRVGERRQDVYGKLYNYGSAFGYGGNYITAPRDPSYEGNDKLEKCAARVKAGSKLVREVVRKTGLMPSFDFCEELCAKERTFFCRSFSYRYNLVATDPTDNCLLSDVSYRDLDFYTDLEPDRNYDVYTVIDDSKACSAKVSSNRNPLDECFWRVRSGFSMPTDITKKSMVTDGLGGCQVACAQSQEFNCRSFAYRYSAGYDRYDKVPNCFLSDWPSREINPATMPDMDGTELYERGSFSRGCEPYTLPFFNSAMPTAKQLLRPDDDCYSGYHRPCKLTPHAVLSAIRVESELECRRKCSTMRNSDSRIFSCKSFSYKITANGPEENCLLSDISIRDLRPGFDYTYDDDHLLYTWKDVDPRCRLTSPVIDGGHQFGPAVQQTYESREPPPIFQSEPWLPSDHGAGSSFIFDESLRHSLAEGVTKDPINGGLNDGIFARPTDPAIVMREKHAGSSTVLYTVNGHPCKNGTECRRNEVAGFWSCEVEGTEYGTWDYCCEPKHSCGFSHGYPYPWCYVGPSADQWRPCSETYYPYSSSKRLTGPSSGPDTSTSLPPEYFARHWPLIYLHKEPPPNCTDALSSAAANTSGNHVRPLSGVAKVQRRQTTRTAIAKTEMEK